MTGKTRPEGYTFTPPPEPARKPSMGFMVTISIILGVTISAGVILGTMGNAFFVTRTEFQGHEKNDVEVTTTFRQTLNQVDRTLSAQAASFKDLASSVEGIRIDMARRR